jgi:hypothetical protein
LTLFSVVIYGCTLPFNSISSSLLLERDYFKKNPTGCQITHPNYCENDLSNPYLSCPSSKWYQPPLPNNITSEYNPLSTSDIDCTDDYWKDNCATSLYCSRLIDAETQASFVMSIPFVMSAVLSPPIGYLVDKFGMRALFATLACIILTMVHSFLAWSTVSAVGPMIGQGFGYTTFVTLLWPSIPLVVEERVTGLAFGIVFSLHNLGLAAIPLIVATVYQGSGNKFIPNVEYLFIGMAFSGVIVGMYLNYYDFTHGNVLNSPVKGIKKEDDDDEEEEESKKKKQKFKKVGRKGGYEEVQEGDDDSEEDYFSDDDTKNVIVLRKRGKSLL